MDPVRFARPGSQRALGCAVYLVVTAVLGCFVGLLVFGCSMAGLGAAGLPEPAAAGLGLVIGLGAVGLLARFAWRDYRRRASLELVLGKEHLELTQGPDRVEIPYGEVETVQLRYNGSLPTLDIEAADGRRVRIPTEIAPFAQVLPVLGARLFPGMAERLERRLQSGQDVPLTDGRARSLLRIVWGVVMILVAPLLIVSIKAAEVGFEFLRLGPARVRQGRRGLRGGFTLTRDGLRPPGEEIRSIPWSDLTALRLDDDGVVLQSLELRRYSASAFAPNYGPLRELLRARLSARPPALPQGE